MKSIYENSSPVKPAKPNGASLGKVGVEYSYSTSTTDPDMEDICYFFDWGDRSNSDWNSPYSSGEIVETSHTWSEQNIYEIITISQDIRAIPSMILKEHLKNMFYFPLLR